MGDGPERGLSRGHQRRAARVLAGQEVGTLTRLVHDTVSAAGTTILSFNAYQLRMIASGL